VITRLDGGAGAHAVRGLEGLDRDAFGSLFITGGRLPDQAAEAGLARAAGNERAEP
jgi:hypothetical protein